MITIIGGGNDGPVALFDNAFARGRITAGPVDGQNVAHNVLGPQTYDYFKPASMPSFIISNLPTNESINSIAIAAHNLGSSGANIRFIRTPSDSEPWVEIVRLWPVNDLPLLVMFPERWTKAIGMEIAGPRAPSIGVVMAGRRFVFPSMVTAPYVPLNRARRVELLAGNSLGGQMFDARIKRLGGDTRIGFNPVPRAWAHDTLPAFADHYDAGKPFFFASSPSLNPTDVAYARRAQGAGELRPEWRAGGRFVDMALEVETYGA